MTLGLPAAQGAPGLPYANASVSFVRSLCPMPIAAASEPSVATNWRLVIAMCLSTSFTFPPLEQNLVGCSGAKRETTTSSSPGEPGNGVEMVTCDCEGRDVPCCLRCIAEVAR